jgi:outer membrane protein OmpA-like peptidoglycan-associated protein
VAPQYIDWKIIQAKVEKLEEQFKSLEALTVSTETRISDLTAILKELQEQGAVNTQRFREEQERDLVAIKQQLSVLEEVSKQMRDLAEVGVIRKLLLQGTVFFEGGQTDLSREARVILDQLGASLIIQNFFSLEVSGHADQEGAPGKEFALSQRRAEIVAEYLIKNFSLDRHKISVAGFGNAYPLAPRTIEEGKRKNRRVEVKAYALSPP